MKSLEVWRRGYKADFSPWRWRSKCKVSPLPCLPWDSMGGVGQGQFCILHKSGIDSPILWRSPGLSSVRVCWDCWQYGRSAWALALSGVQAGRRSFTVIFWPFLSFPSSLPSLCPLPSISWAALACYALGLGAGLGWGRCWSVQAVAVVAGWGWCAAIWRDIGSSYCTNTALQVWLLFKRKAINFERFFLDIAHKVRYNDTRVKEIVNPPQLTASPSAGRRTDGRKE